MVRLLSDKLNSISLAVKFLYFIKWMKEVWSCAVCIKQSEHHFSISNNLFGTGKQVDLTEQDAVIEVIIKNSEYSFVRMVNIALNLDQVQAILMIYCVILILIISQRLYCTKNSEVTLWKILEVLARWSQWPHLLEVKLKWFELCGYTFKLVAGVKRILYSEITGLNWFYVLKLYNLNFLRSYTILIN